MVLFAYCAIDVEAHTLNIQSHKKDYHLLYAFIKSLIKKFGKPQKMLQIKNCQRRSAISKLVKDFKINLDCIVHLNISMI